MGNKDESTNLIGRRVQNDKFLLERKQRLEQNIKEITPESKRQNRLKRITTV